MPGMKYKLQTYKAQKTVNLNVYFAGAAELSYAMYIEINVK